MLELEDFAPYARRVFRVFLPEGGEPVPLELQSLHPGEERRQRGLRACPFVMVFQGPAGRALRPGTYEIAWPDDSRRHAVFVQIVAGSSADGAVYEVIFN